MSGQVLELIDLDRLTDDVAAAATAYAQARPFPHAVFDDVLDPDVFAAACDEFPTLDEAEWTSYLHVNERKYGNTKVATWGPTLQRLEAELNSPSFIAFVSALTGFDELVADRSLDGGGLHQTFRGGHLNLHADFTSHHTNHRWRRRVNALFYLNPDWDESWGGALELWTADRRRCEAVLPPTGNRLVIFTTTEVAYHGHPDPLECPTDRSRRSMALYYFEEQDNPLRQSTDYRARPGEGLRAVPIFLDRQALKVYDVAKRRLRLGDDFASKTMGRISRLRGDRTDESPGPG